MITTLLKIENQIKVFHWQTKSYAEHKALDSFGESFGALVDKLVETYIGCCGELKLEIPPTITLKDYSGSPSILSFLNTTYDYLVNLQKTLSAKTELVNTLDEMKSEVDQLKYLLRLT